MLQLFKILNGLKQNVLAKKGLALKEEQLHGVQGLVKVVNDIGRVLDADRQAHNFGASTRLNLLRFAQLTVHHTGWVSAQNIATT